MVDSLYANNAIRFPFAVQNITADGKFIIQTNWSTNKTLAAGDTLTAINGISTKDIYHQFRRYYGGLEAWRQQMVAANIRKLMFMNHFQSPYSISAITNNGKVINTVVNGLNSKEADSINRSNNQQNQIKKLPFEFTVNTANIAMIQFNSMNRNLADSFSRFLINSFSKMHELQCKGLIIDLRENSGGDSRLGINLINYISSKPYRLATGMKWKISEHYKKLLELIGDNDEEYLKKQNGDMITYIEKNLQSPTILTLLILVKWHY